MASVTKVGQIAVKPLLSNSSAEARRRVLNLYRAWYREVNIYSFLFVWVEDIQCLCDCSEILLASTVSK